MTDSARVPVHDRAPLSALAVPAVTTWFPAPEYFAHHGAIWIAIGGLLLLGAVLGRARWVKVVVRTGWIKVAVTIRR